MVRPVKLPTDHPLYSTVNKMVIGKMKDEAAGKIMCEVVGLRAKMYSFKVYDPAADSFKTTKKAKGIQKAAIERITHEQFLEQLHNPAENHVTVRRIGQVLHTVYTFEQQKRALCAFDDKRYLLDDCIDTLAHGHYKIRGDRRHSDGDDDAHPNQMQGANTLTDDDGDAHVVLTHAAVAQSPMLQELFESGGDDGGMQTPSTSVQDAQHRQRPLDRNSNRPCTTGQRQLHQQQTVNEDELAAARNALSKRIDPLDIEIAQDLIRAALACIDHPTNNVNMLKSMLQQRAGMEALCALDMLAQARSRNKLAGLSDDEQLLFVLVKSTKVCYKPYTMNPHKSVFMLLTDRSANWWDNNHMKQLSRISKT